MKKSLVKKIISFGLIFACLGLSGCIPSGYTKDGVKKVKTEHEAEARNWFAENMPDAKVESADACRDTSSLFQAISGKYKTSNTEYEYIYDYVEDKMYTNEMESQVKDYLLEETVKKTGIDPDRSELTIFTHRINLLSANDNEETIIEYGHTAYGELDSYGANVYLYDSDPKEIAESMIYDEEPIATFSVKTYTDSIPEYNPEIIRSLSGLSYISYLTTMDYEFEGINYAVYYRDFARVTHTHLDEVEDNLYAGYAYEEELEVLEDGSVESVKNTPDMMGNTIAFSRIDSKKFEVTVPVNADLVFFTTKGKYLNCFYSYSGEYRECDVDRSGAEKNSYFPGLDVYEAKYVVPDKKLYCYSLWGSKKPEDGRFVIRQK